MQSQSVSRLSKSRLTCGVRVLLVHPGKVCTRTSCRSTFSSHCKFSSPPSRIKLCEAWRHLAWPWIPVCWAPEKKVCVKNRGDKCNCRHVLSRDTWDRGEKKCTTRDWVTYSISIQFFLKTVFIWYKYLCHMCTLSRLYLILLDQVLHTKCVPLVLGLSVPQFELCGPF